MLSDVIANRLREGGYEGEFTLGALIEACGDKFLSLRHEANSRFKWIACTDSPLFDGYFTIVGESPEDAVGELLFGILGTKRRVEPQS